MLTEQEKKWRIERDQRYARSNIKVIKKDFFGDLPQAIVDVLYSVECRWKEYDWFEEAWNKYREHVLNAETNGEKIKTPGFIFNSYINDQVKEDFLNAEELGFMHSDFALDELFHHGVKGQKWGVRRYQNEDGTYTQAGKRENVRKAAAIATGATLAGALGGFLAAKRRIIGKKFTGENADLNYKKAIAKVALVGVGSAIVGGLIGKQVNQHRHNKEERQLQKTYGKTVPNNRIGRM